MRKISIRGWAARNVVKMVNHFPVLGQQRQSGSFLQSGEEKEWNCPKHLSVYVMEREHFSMELLQSQTGGDHFDIIMQLHGGGYYGKMRNIYRNMAGLYHEVSGEMDVLSVDYRVAPENPYPAALEDAVEAYEWILGQGYVNIWLAGDSAGGGLALALGMYLRDHGKQLPRGIITMSAWADLTASGSSYEENYNTDPVFGGTKNSLVYQNEYYKDHDPKDPYISPVNGDYTGFPPMLMQVGENEMLLSDTNTVVQKAKAAGVLVRQHIYSGMFHVFQMGLLSYPESRQAWVEVGKFIRKTAAPKND